MIHQVNQYLQDNNEKVKLFGYFIVMLALALPVSKMLGEAWRQAHLFRAPIRLRHLVGLSLQQVTVILLGIFLGLLLLMTIDPKKRIQATLLWIGVIVGLLGLRSMGLFLPQNFGRFFGLILGNFTWLGSGLLISAFLGGGRRLTRVQTAEALEFRRASKAIYYIITLMVVAGFLEYHVSYPEFLQITEAGISLKAVESMSVSVVQESLLKHAAVSGVFLVTVKQFVQYDAQKDFFVLGPRASGKSLFLIGAYLEALERSRNDESNTPMKPSEDLMDQVEELDRSNSGWTIEATGRGQVKNLAFQYVHGSVFPTNVQLSSADYAGEYLSRLPDALTGLIDEEDTDETLLHLANGITAADTLLLLLDAERFVNNEPLEVSEYFSILQAIDDKDIILVATKTDHLAEDFRNERGLEAHRYYDDFKEYVNEQLRQSNQIDSLVRETAGTEIHPVYYQTHTNEADERVPMRDDRGSVMTVGFERLLEKLGRY
ncbi:hypothetical protein [Halorussus salinisoli]|uniref:hypothetical protein n=1 Tax=Halorussus salinisoli TaxID=2558242 RepID=UPI0010C18B98|nr:hypothetical protein [Halorussus salinisoli]